MSENTKKRVQSVKNALINANYYVSDAATYASSMGDKILVEKIEKIKAIFKETNEYIATRTGENS